MSSGSRMRRLRPKQVRHMYPLMGGRSCPQKREVCTPTPGVCEYVSLHGKRDLANIMKGIDLKIGQLSWIVQWAYVITAATFSVSGTGQR